MNANEELMRELDKLTRSGADELRRDWWEPRIREVLVDLARVTAERDAISRIAGLTRCGTSGTTSHNGGLR